MRSIDQIVRPPDWSIVNSLVEMILCRHFTFLCAVLGVCWSFVILVVLVILVVSPDDHQGYLNSPRRIRRTRRRVMICFALFS